MQISYCTATPLIVILVPHRNFTSPSLIFSDTEMPLSGTNSSPVSVGMLLNPLAFNSSFSSSSANLADISS